MDLFVFVGLAWLLTAPAVGVLTGKLMKTCDRPAREESLFRFLEDDLRHQAQPSGRR